MTAFNATQLAEPLSAELPCGLDLDLEGDPEYLQCVAFVEGVLPLSFFSRDDSGQLHPFDRTTIDFSVVLKRVGTLFERTRDLRLLTLYGRLSALNRDLAGLAAAIEASAILLQDQWEGVHPRGEDGDFTLRSAILQAFDDMPTIVLPLQHLTLADSRRHGSISFRTIMTANGEITPQNGEEPLDRGSIERAFTEAKIEALQSLQGQIGAIQKAIATIRAVSIANAGYAQAVSLDRLDALVGRIVSVLDPVIRSRTGAEPESAVPDDVEAGSDASLAALPRAKGRIESVPDASSALAAAADYLRRSEPSSPAELLVRQAQGLVGKSFLEVLNLLVPRHAEAAVIALGTDKVLKLTFDQLVAVPHNEARGLQSDQTEENESLPEWDARSPSEPPQGAPVRAETRQAAVNLLKEVSAFYRAAEPSSPIPLLLDRARGMIERDFLSILKDVLPGLGASDMDM